MYLTHIDHRQGLSRRGLTVIKLAVGLLTVDDVEAVVRPNVHPAHLKIEPLVIVVTVDVRVEHQVVLVPSHNETLFSNQTPARHTERQPF